MGCNLGTLRMYRDCEGIMCFLVGLGILRILLANSQRGISNSGGRPVIPQSFLQGFPNCGDGGPLARKLRPQEILC